MKTQIKYFAYVLVVLGLSITSCDEENDPQPKKENTELLKAIRSIPE